MIPNAYHPEPICTQSCSAAGYNPAACVKYGCQALQGERMAQFPPETAQAYQPSRAAREMDRANALKSVEMPLDDLDKQINTARERVINLTALCRKAADHLIGSEPEGPEDGVNHPPRAGKVGSLLDSAEYLHNCIGVLERQLGRLSPLVTS